MPWMSAESFQALTFSSPPQAVYKAQREYAGKKPSHAGWPHAAYTPPRLQTAMHGWAHNVTHMLGTSF